MSYVCNIPSNGPPLAYRVFFFFVLDVTLCYNKSCHWSSHRSDLWYVLCFFYVLFVNAHVGCTDML